MKNVISQSFGLDLVNIKVYAKVYQHISISSRDKAIFTISELALGKASTNDKCLFAISWTRCRQYQCVCKILSKYSKPFKSYRHFSRTGRGQNHHILSGDKIKCLIIGNSIGVNLQFQLTFLGSCNKMSTQLKRWSKRNPIVVRRSARPKTEYRAQTNLIECFYAGAFTES